MKYNVFRASMLPLVLCLPLPAYPDIWARTEVTYVRPNGTETRETIMHNERHASTWDALGDLAGMADGFYGAVSAAAELNPLGVAGGIDQISNSINSWQRAANAYNWAADQKVLFVEKGADYEKVVVTFLIHSNDDPLFAIEYSGVASSPGVIDVGSSITTEREGSTSVRAAERTVTLFPKRMESNVYGVAFSSKENDCTRDCLGISHVLTLVVNCNAAQCNQTPAAQAIWQQTIELAQAEIRRVQPGFEAARDERLARCMMGTKPEQVIACRESCYRSYELAMKPYLDKLRRAQAGKAGNVPPRGFDNCATGRVRRIPVAPKAN